MANEEHLKILKQGVEVWNKWRDDNPEIKPHLYGADLSELDLNKADFYEANLGLSKLHKSNLTLANLSATNLREADLSLANLSWGVCQIADLSKADLSEANLSEADFRGACLYQANLQKVDLSLVNLGGANLIEANLFRANLGRSYLAEAKLVRANLSETDLSIADLSRADLLGANLQRADLNKTLLIETNLTGANITGAILSGTARDNWIINDIKCKFVYLFYGDEGKRPKERDFYPGEFEELYRQLPLLEYVFEKDFSPIDAIIMDSVVQKINEKHPEFELKLDSFHSRGQPHAVFTVHHKDVAEVALSEIKRDYESRIASLEAERDAIERCFLNVIEKPRTYIDYSKKVESGDKYKIQGQTGAAGPNAHVHDIKFKQLWNQISSSIDVARLADELSRLRQAMKKESETLEHDTAVGEIAAAEAAAKDGKGPKALEHLKKAGKWAFSVAENIGTTIAAETLKKAMGL